MNSLNLKSALKVCVLSLAVAGIFWGCAEVADTGVSVPIPRITMNCTTAQCRTNSTAPKINNVVTRSGCVAPLFDAVISTSTQSYNCTSVIGCQGEFSGWINSQGTAVTKMPSGTYSICGCIDYDNNSTPFVNCDSSGTKDGVAISTTTGLQSITSWVD